MSSAEDERSTTKTKARRITRACDSCRRKKIRCDGATADSNRCSNCSQYDYECTYVEAAKKRGPPKGYVENLESRLQKMETLLQRLCPDADFTRELEHHMDRETWYNEKQKRGGANPPYVKKSRPPSPSPTAWNTSHNLNHPVSEEIGGSDDDPSLPVCEDEPQQQQTVTSSDRRFHGRSSGLVLAQTAIDMRREYAGGDLANPEPTPKREFLSDPAWEGKRVRAPEEVEAVNFEFPPPDLMASLIPHYFFHNNLYLPLLHRPTFERQYQDGLHHKDSGFAAILLLVCAIAARTFDDPRVLRDGEIDDTVRHSAGWKYFDQLHMHRRSLTSPATLYDLQQYALAAIFLKGSTVPYASWVMVGIGLRVAQDVGAHRKRPSNGATTVEDELWKRCFWVLVNLDRMGSSALGRPCAIHDEDFDLDPPLEVDDDYWESPNHEDAFKQPAHIPSTVAYFKAAIKLDQILSYALRTIYSINKTKMLVGFVGKQWEQHTVAELDSMLNSWVDSLPEHLQWITAQENSVFFRQSSILHATYYHIQILVHRPFIPGPKKPAKVGYPSLTICTNAARSCSRVLDTLRNKCDAGPAPHLMFYAFTSGLVLLLNIWGVNKPGGMGVDTATAMQDVHKCMQYLHVAQARWPLAGRLKDIMCELASAGEFPLPIGSPEINNKRERDSDSPKSAPASDYPVAPPEPAVQPRPIARPRMSIAARRVPASLNAQSSDFSLPLNSVDLGRLPLHPDFYPQQQQQATSISTTNDVAMAGVSWYPDSQQLPSAEMSHPSSTFGSPAPEQVLQMFGSAGGADSAHMFPASAPPFVGDFNAQISQQAFPGPAQAGTEQNHNWGGTLDMWSTAPTGFEWEDWNNFTTNIPNIVPVIRSDVPNQPHLPPT